MHAHNEGIYVGWGAFGVHFHTKGSIQNPALYAKLVGTSIHKGAETHPLYNAFYCYVSCFAHDVFLSCKPVSKFMSCLFRQAALLVNRVSLVDSFLADSLLVGGLFSSVLYHFFQGAQRNAGVIGQVDVQTTTTPL